MGFLVLYSPGETCSKENISDGMMISSTFAITFSILNGILYERFTFTWGLKEAMT